LCLTCPHRLPDGGQASGRRGGGIVAIIL